MTIAMTQPLYSRVFPLIPIIVVYNRAPDSDHITQTKETLRHIISTTTDWSAIRLEKEVREVIRMYDPYAVRVYLQDRHVANIPYPNSPILNLLIDLTEMGLVLWRGVVSATLSDDNVGLYLSLEILPMNDEIDELLSDYALTPTDFYGNPIPEESHEE